MVQSKVSAVATSQLVYVRIPWTVVKDHLGGSGCKTGASFMLRQVAHHIRCLNKLLTMVRVPAKLCPSTISNRESM